MGSPACSCVKFTGGSVQNLEPSMLPAFDAGEKNQSKPLLYTSRLGCVMHGDLSQKCSALRAAWGILLSCFTGLEKVYFAFEHSGTTSSGHADGITTTAHVDVHSHRQVRSLLVGNSSALLSVPQDTAKTLLNTALCIGSFANELSHHDDQNQTKRHDSVSWCKIRMFVDPATFHTVLWWDPRFMTREQAGNVSNTYDKIVSELTNHPETLISDLNYFGDRNERQVLLWNTTPQSNVRKCIHQAVSEQGALRPYADAVYAWDGNLSYNQLLSFSDRLASRLQTSGIGPEVFVPICFDKSKWTVVAMLAVLKAGGIFVPLDPTHPLPRLRALASKVKATTILCSPQHQAMLASVAAELIPVDDQLFTNLAEQHGEVNLGSSHNGAYMIFTSGTTGEPKGALIAHGALVSSALAHGPAMMMDHNTRSLHFAASTFDVSITEILTCLILGGCVCIPSEEARLNAIEDAITQLQANWALLTPTFVKFINPDNVPTLKTLVTGGEAMTQAVIQSWSHINLINCYGPAETSVVSHVHRGMKPGMNPLNIGHQVGIHCWVVDRYNHNRLVPVGAVGELVIEGHTLAREYYNEPEKTNEAFIVDPAWTRSQPRCNSPRRMYKTGDLVRYNCDGTFNIRGRKDSQIKFHGQRIELGEIEHHLNISPVIKHGMVVLARDGLCKGRLLAIVQLSDDLNQDLVPKGRPYRLIDGELEDTARTKVAEAKKMLTERLPPYMVPSTWLAVEFIPRLQSGKLDRKQTSKWIDDMSEELYQQLNPVTATGTSGELIFSSKTELELHKIWTHVLNLDAERLGLRQSFLSIGGDSISAMQVMSECKKRGLGLTVSRIIASKSISALALQVKNVERQLVHKEILEQPFELSPIQKLYFSRPDHAQGHYNQSFLLRTNQRIAESDLRKAIDTVVRRQSMLRARFSQDPGGQWQQRVTNEVESSYRLRTLHVASIEEVDHNLVGSQTCLEATRGPLFAADLINVDGEEQLLFVVAHHLVIDLVSWRIILQELEELLIQSDEPLPDMGRILPFQIWCKMQSEHAEAQTPEKVLPIHGIPDGNLEYWGMSDQPNVYGEMAHEGFEIGPEQTSLLVSKCHDSLRTEIPDVLMAAMIFSFGQTFTDRSIPAVFAEGHGRESWDPSIDLSNVVGWFTTIYPVFAGSTSQSSLVDTVKMVKDARRKVPDSGRPYFASRWLTKAGEESFSRHWPLEITFNYLGQYQQLEREGALFTPYRTIAGEVRGAADGADIGPLTPCISLFEVSAVILKGSLRFSFAFNQNMKHQPEIRQWISFCQHNLGDLVETLSVMAPEHTLSDFPLLSLTYDHLRVMMEQKLPMAGVRSMDLVEDIYPCSLLQSGLLISTAKNSAFYAAYTLHEVKTRSGSPVDATKLARAWKHMIQYHPILRTIFVESVTQQDSPYDQVVLKEVDFPLIVSERDTEEEALMALGSSPLHQKDKSDLLHHFEICTSTSGKVFCRLDISHVIMDGTSLSILFRDLAMAYEGSLESRDGPLYRNYIEYLQGQAIQPGIDYWKSHLAGLEPCHFPVLDDGDVVESKELRQLRVNFDELVELQRLCDGRGVTIVNAIYAAWALTLRLYTASEEVCFGYLTSARDSQIEGIQDVVGPVINMVPCRVNVSSSTTLGDVMSLVQRDYLDSLEYRHVSLAEVQHALQLSDAALFNTALSYRKLPRTPENPPDLMFEECRPTYDPDEYNVSINIEADDNDMAVDLMYWSDTLSDGQAANVAATFTKALSNVLHHCNQPIAQLEYLGPWHRQQLSQWNQQIPEPIESCVHDLFQRQANVRPDAPAIASWPGDKDFTYAELDDASTNLAIHISSLGVGLEDFVLVCFNKTAFAMVAMLAIMKAGGVCVPLDPAHPDAALQLRAEDTGASVALVAPSMVTRIGTMVGTAVAVDAQLLRTISVAPDVSLPQVTPDNACFVIYTSGSTGRPKGVVLEHRGIATSAEYSGPKLGYGKDSRVLQFASHTFDNSIAEMFFTLTRGGCVCVPSDHERLNDLTGAINRHNVTLADLTPTVACLIQPTDVPTLKTLALGGEAVTTTCVDMWRDFVSLQCCYGPSECSINSTYSGEIAQPGKATNIGRAVGSVAWVVDAADHNSLVPIGCVGELLVDGPIVSRGYLNLPERMAQSFISPPACLHGIAFQGNDPDRKLYKTGDLVRYNCDGTLTYLGRKDQQVKLNGQRIELGEIEHHIQKNLPDGWMSAVELILSDGRKSLACFICSDADASLADSSDGSIVLGMNDASRALFKDLEILLSTLIPAYMVPSVWLPINKMPLTPSGKLNRVRLRQLAQLVPAPLMASYKLALKSGRAPSSEMEKQLAAMWACVLNIDEASIGVEDNFFRLGGDSIGAMRLVTLARQSEIDLTVANIFEKTSLLDMAHSAQPMTMAITTTIQPYSLLSNVASVDVLKREVAASARIDVEAIQDMYPCTPTQEGLVALSIKEPGAYVARLVYRLQDDIDVARFKKACDLVVQAQPTLRTRIIHTEGFGFVQVVVAEDAPQWSTVDSLGEVEKTRRQLPLHNGGRLTNYNLVHNASTGVYFVWDIHHALYDGWCLPLILDKIKRCYEEDSSFAQFSGPPYSNFIQYVAQVDMDAATEFWESHLSNVSMQPFPRLPSPEYQASASSLIIHKADLSRRSSSEITMATRIRAAWALTVSTYSASNDVVFWETLSGRDAPVHGVEEIVGATLATVPTRMVLDSSHTVTELLRDVQARSSAVRRHQYAGIQHIKRINSDTALACGAQNLIAINHGSRETTDSFWDEQTNEMAGTNFYSYPLMLSFHIGDCELETVVHFDKDILPEPHMRRVMDHFALMLKSISSPQLMDDKVGNLDLLSPLDIQTLRKLNNSPKRPISRLIHEVIQAQGLTQAQEKLAVCAWDQSLTYSELDSLSTRLACLLVENGVGVNSIVPFCMEKSSLVVISILAILKSGAAFVSLDPAHPDARINSILADVDATVVLCSPNHADRLEHFEPKAIQVSQDLFHGVSALHKPTVSLSPNNAAYVIFTSGTTGKPKGTIVGHSAFCTSANAHGSAMNMTESSRVLQFASSTFDASIMEILTTLIHGGTVCVPSDEERINDLAGAINRMHVNWALLTPSVAQLISPSLVPGLKTLVLGGEAMSSAHVSSWASSVQLMNAYGPSETAVTAAINPNVTITSSASDIGYGVGCTCWVVDATNHNRLMPIGAVGELLVEGPTLAEGYLKNPQKTAESFITNPTWCGEFPGTVEVTERRMYKTGDLVKLSEDGAIQFQNRKDDQVKVNGQRLELSEVEHHLSADALIQHSLAAVPSSGPFKSRLVAILSLQSLVNVQRGTVHSKEMQVVAEYPRSEIKQIRENLAQHLAAYMVPSSWIVVERIHLLPSGKLDRRRVVSWVEGMDPEQHRMVLDAQEKTSSLDRDASEVELTLRAAWAKVLNAQVDSVPFERSFLHLGGDSISAMQLVAVSRSLNMAISVGQIMKSKSIIELASCVTAVEDVVHEQERENECFDLSPIQKVYFECFRANSTHFNQSLLLGTTRTINIRQLSSALETIIKTHSMLRARFTQIEGSWYQRITGEVSGSYTLRSHDKVKESHISALIEESQKSLNIVEGPLLAADIFEVDGTGKQIVSFVAHHLVVDVVSWNVIMQDLEDLMSSAPKSPTKPLSFQTWLSLQREEVHKIAPEHVFHDVPAPRQDLSFWEMQGVPNLHGDSINDTMEMSADDSLLLLGSCHGAFDTEVVDVLLASLLVTFSQTFSDRPTVPSIFNEGHGREAWDDKLDLSRTVGWFTTLCPVYLPEPLPSELDILDAVSWVKDFRRKLPGNGRPYFAHNMLAQQSESHGREWPAEVAFNFLGNTEMKRSAGSVFTSLSGNVFESTGSNTDIGADVPRLALIEISAAISDHRLSFSFSFNRHMSRQPCIRKWMAALKESIHEASQILSETRHAQPIADLSLLPLAFRCESQIKRKLSEIGISHFEDVEAAYPCSPVQQGILLSQIRDPNSYSYSITFLVRCRQPAEAVDMQRLAEAWQHVVERHSTLRTVFVDNLLQEGGMDQVVLRKHLANIAFLEHSHTEQTPGQLSLQSLPRNQPPHRLEIFKDSEGTVTCVLEMSHAIADGSSMPILFRDLALAYEGALATTGLSVYRDYVAHLQRSQIFQNLNYWKEYLAGVEPCYLPSRTGGATAPKTLRALDWSISHVAELQAFCIERGATLSNVLQLAWALVLQAYTGLEDVLFGYLVAGRDIPVRDIDQAVGVYINMLVCRVRLSPSTSLGNVLNTVQEDLAASMSHKHVSLADLQHAMGTSNEPLFNTAYSFQRRSVSKSMATGPVSFDISDARDPSEYDLTVNVEVWDSNVELQLCYWTDKILDSQAKNIASTLDQILTSIVTCDLAMPIGGLSTLSEHCSEQLVSWNYAEPEYLDECVHRVVEQNARWQTVETPAIEAWDARFTYLELDAAASQLAQHLISLGVKPETYVPLCFNKSAWTVVAMLAVLKAGGAFVPLDPSYPPERVGFIVRNVDAKLILCSSSLAHKFETLGIPTFAVAAETVSLLPDRLAGALPVQVRPDHPAYIIFTSGTTGLPKGTIIEHGAFTTGATAHAKAIEMTSTSRVLQFASHTFDASVMEILSTLLAGGCICIPSDQERMNDLAAVINKLKVNWTLLTPSVASVLKPDSVPTLEVLVTGGEAMATDHIAKWAKHSILINAYGPSEASVIAATSTKVGQGGQVLDWEPATIGHAVGCRSWIVDPRNHDRLMPIGSIGELLVEGPIVARGYLGNPTQTKDAFIEHPLWRKRMNLAGGRTDRMYKTGDLVAYNPDGSLSYIARRDTQVKLNGQRIEVAEIEHHVKSNLPAEVQSAVDLVVPQSKTSTKALAVFFTSIAKMGDGVSGETETDAILLPQSSVSARIGQSLKTALRGALPSHMVPTMYIPVNKIPWTLAGKLDRKRLKAIAQSIKPQQIGLYKLAGVSTNRAPTTSTQRKLQKVWAKILKSEPGFISVDDNFFRLGGDSIGAMKLVAAARTEYIILTAMNVFENPVLSDMAASCKQSNGTSTATVEHFSLLRDVGSPSLLLGEISERCGVQRSQIQDVYPCSPLQEGLVAASLQNPGAYVARNVYELPMGVDIDRLKLAWQHTVDQVDILRSRVVNSQSLESYQVILESHDIEWEVYNSLELANGKVRPVPGHNGGVLARYAIVTSADSGTRYLVWTVHHALYDAWSMPSVIDLVSHFYDGDGSERLKPAIPFANFAKYLADVDVQASDEFWKFRFQGTSPATHFPTISAKTGAESSSASLRHTIHCGKDNLGVDVTRSAVVRAAWALVLGAQTGSDDVVFGETLSGRDINLDHVEDIVGPTLTTVPSRIQIDRDATVGQLLKTIHSQATAVIPHQHSGLQHIKRLGGAVAVACDFKNLLVIQSAGEARIQQGLLKPMEDGPEQSNFFTYPLVVECFIEAHDMVLLIHHDEAVLKSWQVKRIAHQFEALVEQLIHLSGEPTSKVSDLRLYGQEDIEMIKEWNQGAFDPVQESISSLFWRSAITQPNATSIRAWDGHLSYDALAQYAGYLAKLLIEKGVGAETLVPCCMDKSVWTTVSMLAVTLAGGAIVPMDPAQPPARHAEIARDCEARVALCSLQYQDRFNGVVESVVLVNRDLFTAHSSPQGISPQDLPVVANADAAFVIYTSGSTGRPKGVVIEHGSFCASSKGFMHRLNLTSASSVFHFTSYAFDMAMAETFMALTSGACLCVPSEDMRITDLPGAMNSLRATWAFLTPSVANIQDPSKFKTLKTLVCGGEALTSETISTWADQVELMNGYGPAECTFLAVANTHVSVNKEHSSIGRAMNGCHTWVVDPRDHNVLVPVGCTGELLISGPIVARGYLNDGATTVEKFVQDPTWMHHFFSEGNHHQKLRLYKTGDLAKYNHGGTLEYKGRKDHQVKIHGQRMELGEIEARLESDQHIRQAFVTLPKAGLYRGRLVAIVSLEDDSSEKPSVVSSEFTPVSASEMQVARTHVAAFQNDLCESLPLYMVPSTWFVVESIPLLLSGKLDRTSAQTWLADMDADTWKLAISSESIEDVALSETTPFGQQLRRIWASVLKIAEEKVPMNRSLISLGGDSITAIQVVTRCREQSIRLSMQEVMRGRSISDLATLIERDDRQMRNNAPEHEEEPTNDTFELSPIQHFFFNNSTDRDSGDRFNQSQLLSINGAFDVSRYEHAFRTLVQRHPMLRARFTKSVNGQWTQTIASEVETSYGFHFHKLNARPEMIPLLAASQKNVKISGPVFVVDVFEQPDGSQVVSLIAHHLVVDVVSWINIVQDLEKYLSATHLISSKPFSFRAWNEAQIEHARSLERQGEPILPFRVQPADFDFWGMSSAANNYGDVIEKIFTVSDPKIVSLLLGDSNTALKTESLDLFISALLKSFGNVFTERELPTLFNEGHGREPWDDTIDISQTVGWFTSLSPVHVSRGDVDPYDTVDCVRKVKDVRRSVPSNGRPYFAHRYLTESGKRQLENHELMEILVNFLGRTQQTSQGESLFSSFDVSMDDGETTAVGDVASETRRLALFEVSVSILDNGVQFAFMYNKHMFHQDRIEKWTSNCEEVLIDIATRLSQAPYTPTLSDFPLMPLDYADLRELVTKSIPAARVRFDDVEDMYPCSPMQTGILLSQLLDPSQYLFHTIVEVTSPGVSAVDAVQLSQACYKVIERHPALRTIFLGSTYRGGSFDQVVLKPREAGITIIECREIDVMAKLNLRSLHQTNKRHDQPMLPYQITICKTPQGKVFLKLELNHAVTDGASTSIILRDISNAYISSLPLTSAPSYKECIKYISNQPTDASLGFWSTYLSGAPFTGFPNINPDITAGHNLGSVVVQFDRFSDLHAIARQIGVTLSNMIVVAWALVLRSYTRSDDVSFGYLASGRDARIDGIEEIVGPLINMLVFRFRFAGSVLLKRLFLDAQQDYLSSLPHQHFSLARVSHQLGQAKRGFFNTAVSIQNTDPSSDSDPDALMFESMEAFDPSEYAVTLNANTARGDEGIVFRYWTDILSDSQARDLSHTMSTLLRDFVDRSEDAVSQLQLFQHPLSLTNGFKHTNEVGLSTFTHDDSNLKRAATFNSSASSGSSTDLGASLFSPLTKSRVLTRSKDTLHQKLLSLWRDTLGLGTASISHEDSFFELGGDSIIAMSMVGNARDLKIQLTVADIFNNPRFGSMLDCLLDRSCKDSDTESMVDQVSSSESKKELGTLDEQAYQPFSMLGQEDAEKFVQDHVCTTAGVSRASILDVLPTTDFQTQAIMGSLLASRWMLNHFYLDSTGPLNIALLQESIANVVACYEVLRTVFVPHQGRYLQVILRQLQPDLAVHDVDDIEKFTSELESIHQQETPQPEKPSLQFILARHNSSSRHRIFIRISHAQYDGVCFPAILESLKSCYEGEPIFPKPSYVDYIRGAMGTITLDHYTYWRALLEDSTPTSIVPRQRNSLQTSPTQVLKTVVSTPSLASVNITTATVVKAAWSTVLAKATGKTDVVFGHLISGRNLGNVVGIESIVGPCLNVVPVRVCHQPSWTVLQLLQHIQNQQVENMPYESLGFKEIIDKCTDWDDNGVNGFSTVVQHQSMPQTSSLKIGGNTYEVGAIASQEDTADFSVVTTPQDANSTEVCLLYARDGTIDAGFAEEIFDSLCRTMTAFSDNLNDVVGLFTVDSGGIS